MASRTALVEEIRRLTLVVVPAERKGGWQTIPLGVAVERGFLTADDRAEVENAIVFFIVNSAVLPRAQRREMLEEASNLWGARISSSTPSEFAASLPKSTATARSGAKAPCSCGRCSGRRRNACGRPGEERGGRRETCVGACLDWAANEGFHEYIAQGGDGFAFSSAHEYRQRNLMLAIMKRGA